MPMEWMETWLNWAVKVSIEPPIPGCAHVELGACMHSIDPFLANRRCCLPALPALRTVHTVRPITSLLARAHSRLVIRISPSIGNNALVSAPILDSYPFVLCVHYCILVIVCEQRRNNQTKVFA